MEHKPVNGMELQPFEEMIGESRERILNATSDALDAELARFIIPSDRIAFLEDFAKFACFMAALKVAEVKTPALAVIDAKEPLRAWWPIGKMLDKEIAPMLLEYGREAANAQLKGSGNVAS
jgi:hypothetical protein